MRRIITFVALAGIEETTMRRLGKMDRDNLMHRIFGFIILSATFQIKVYDEVQSRMVVECKNYIVRIYP